MELEFLGREWLSAALRASPDCYLAPGGRCFLVGSDVRELLWLACRGLAGLGLLSLYLTCGHATELLRLERN